MSDNMNYLYTAGAYAALIGAGYAIYQISSSKNRRRAGAQSKPTRSTDAAPKLAPRKEDRKKKQRLDSFTSDAQEASKKASKAAKADTSKLTESQSWANIAAEGNDKGDDVNNNEFAKQLSRAQEGHKLAAKSDANGKQNQKSVKQSRANKIEATTAPSDADDDRSPVGSPAVQAADPAGVADMLEPAPAAPSILRLTNTEDKSKPKKTKVPEQVETKKQRQNRKKAEAAKVVREEAEKERKVLEEQQRRQARVAEGRLAKDGSQFTNASVSKWNQGAPNGHGKQTEEAAAIQQPLDTFEKPTGKAAPERKQPQAAKASDIEDNWVHALPSEEEQLEMLKDDADDWNTVKTKKSSKKAGEDTTSSEETAARPVAAPLQQTKPVKTASNLTAKQNFGSFSALSSNDETAEDVEEEWDV